MTEQRRGPGPRTVGAILPTVAALLALAVPPGAGAAEGVSRGKEIADRQCAACHATGREDESRHPKAPAFRTLHRRYPVEHLAEALAEGLVVAHPDMPEVRLEPDDLDAFIDYLKSLER